MKILHLTGDLEDNGGILSVIRNLQTASKSWGLEHVVWVNQSYEERRLPPLSYRFSRYLISESDRHFELLWHAVRAIPELKKLLKHEKFDLLHAHTRGALPLAMLISAFWRKPVIFTSHMLGTRTYLYRFAARMKNLYLVLLTHNMAEHYGLTVSPPKLNLISACCADRFFEEPLVLERYSPNSGQPLKLAAIGNIVRWKKWDLIIKAIHELSKSDRKLIKLSFWGPIATFEDSKRYKKELDNIISQFNVGSQVQFCGPTNSIAEVIRQSHWLVHPTPNEPCSVSIMESLALGLPALVAAAGGAAEIVQNGINGLHFFPDSPTDLAAKLTTILHQDIQMPPSSEIRESVRFRSATAVAEKYRTLYDEVLRAAESSL